MAACRRALVAQPRAGALRARRRSAWRAAAGSRGASGRRAAAGPALSLTSGRGGEPNTDTDTDTDTREDGERVRARLEAALPAGGPPPPAARERTGGGAPGATGEAGGQAGGGDEASGLAPTAVRGSVLGAVALITGSTIGCGILALPTRTAAAGFVPSAAVLLAASALLMCNALLLAEVNMACLRKRRAQASVSCCALSDVVSLPEMAAEVGGSAAATAISALYLALCYALLVAFVAKAGATIGAFVPWVSPAVAGTAFAATLAVATAAGGTRGADIINRWLTAALLAAFAVVMFGVFGITMSDWSGLGSVAWAAAPAAAPIAMQSLVYHDLVPVIVSYLGADRRRVRLAMVLGSALPLLMMLAWEGVALGFFLGPSGMHLAAALADPVDALTAIGGAVAVAVRSFSLLAIATSILSTALGMYALWLSWTSRMMSIGGAGTSMWNWLDGRASTVRKVALAAAMALRRPWRRYGARVFAMACVLAPPAALAACGDISEMFMASFEFAGAYVTSLLFGCFPPAAAWVLRSRAARTGDGATGKDGDGAASTPKSERELGGGMVVLATLLGVALTLFGTRLARDVGGVLMGGA